MLGLAHLIGQTELTVEQRDDVAKIKASGRSLLGILDDILDFSKIEADRLEVEHIDFRLATVFDDLATILSVSAAAKNIEAVIAIDPALPRRINGDPSRLQQVLVNLTGNAIKFTETGTVSVRADLAAGEHPVIRFTVEDTGIGMTEDVIGRLFCPFTQADSSTTRRFGGTGLGLVICKRLVELMGGDIGVSSTPGRGSSFWFTIPFLPGDRSDEPEIPLKGLSVLIVDDNDIARRALSSTIEALGWSSETAASGQAALDRLRSCPSYDLLLIDWQMPGMDGLETCRRIRAETTADKTPVVIMVTSFKSEFSKYALDADAVDAVLTKPLTTSSLYETATRIEGKRRSVGRLIVPVDGLRVKGVRVLVVEDNAVNQKVAQKILENEGAAVEIAGNGAEALEWLRHNGACIDAVLMDAQMPVMDGFEATRRIRQELRLADLPIIALSAGVRLSERERCLESGMNDFISKPLEVDKLIATILRLTAKKEREAPVDDSAPAGAETLWAAIPGLDWRQALRRLSGDEATLRRLLLQIAKENKTIVADLRSAIEQGRLREGAARLHNLKGGAGNLGLTLLAQISSDAEAAILDGQVDRLVPLVDELERHLIAFRLAAKKMLASEKVKGRPTRPVEQTQIDRLKTLLSERSVEAIELYEQIASAISAMLGEERARALTAAMEKFEFAGALSVLTDEALR